MSGSQGTSGAIGVMAIGQGQIGVSGPTPSPTPSYLPANTRILSWLQLVQEADPNYRQMSNRPMAYVFSNGRMFYDPVPLYGTPFITDDFGTNIVDDYGTKIQADTGYVAQGTGTGTSTTTGFPFGQGAFGVDSF